MSQVPNATPPISGSSGGNDLVNRMLDQHLADLAEERRAADSGSRAVSKLKGKRTRRQFFGIHGLMAIRSGYEKRKQEEAIERLAEQEFREAGNGVTN